MWERTYTREINDNGRVGTSKVTEWHQSWYDPVKESAGAAAYFGLGLVINVVAIPISLVWGIGRSAYGAATGHYGKSCYGETEEMQFTFSANKRKKDVDIPAEGGINREHPSGDGSIQPSGQ